MDKQEKQFLKTEKSLYYYGLVVGLRQLRQPDADGKGQQEQRKDIALEDGLDDVVGNDRKVLLDLV